ARIQSRHGLLARCRPRADLLPRPARLHADRRLPRRRAHRLRALEAARRIGDDRATPSRARPEFTTPGKPPVLRDEGARSLLQAARKGGREVFEAARDDAVGLEARVSRRSRWSRGKSVLGGRKAHEENEVVSLTGIHRSLDYNRTSMFRSVLLCLLGALLLISADTPQKSAFDKPTLEAYVRHLFLIAPQITVTPGDPKPSDLPGFKEVTVRLSQGPQFQDVKLYVSNDGKKILQGNHYDVATNPFKPESDKLHTQFQPNVGTAGAPVAIVVFSDLQCPHCKGEAEMLRQNLIQNYPKEVHLYFKDFPIESLHPWAKAA